MQNYNNKSNNKIYNSTDENIRPINVNTYLHDFMPEEIENFKNGSFIKSGYENLDNKTNLYPGLYVLGATSSLGKTTFMLQMCDQFAEAGQHVLLFSLEQSALELVSKSLSRILAKKYGDEKPTSLDIRKGEKTEQVREAINEYSAYAGNITCVECNFNVTIEDIERFVKEYIRTNNINPIVIIDYLQVIQAPENSRMCTKDLVDMHVRRLKKLQSDYNIVLLIISSVNRQNYLTPIDYESFKESGGIEYTADVVWGLQLHEITKEGFENKSICDKRKAVKEAKASDPRKIDLVCLKNRFGISSYSVVFDYYPKHDWFRPNDNC